MKSISQGKITIVLVTERKSFVQCSLICCGIFDVIIMLLLTAMVHIRDSMFPNGSYPYICTQPYVSEEVINRKKMDDHDRPQMYQVISQGKNM